MDQDKELIKNGGYTMHTFEDVKALYYPYIHKESDRNLILKAYEFCNEKHTGIFRKSGEPYVQHLIEVAYICAQLQAGPVTIEAAFLHDTVEDTDTTIEDIEEMFGADCAKIVDSLTKIQRLKLSKRTQEEFEAEDHRKIFLGMAKDVRVIIIKLADRLHNMRTIYSLSIERQLALAKETLEVFAPIAHRLGIYKVESELEDLSLKIIKPIKYKEISDLLDAKIRERTRSLNVFKKKLGDIAFNANIPFEIESRVKSIYSIYKKMVEKGKEFNQIYDVLALRIITDSSLHCYELLGLIHQEYKPIPGRFKDYIAVPKSNMYQSLHTSIISGDGNIFEVQIRTKEMDEVAETGVAAHWRYKENENYDPRNEQRDIEEKLHWFRDFVSISNDNSDTNAQEYLENLSRDIFDTSIFVFTPKGKVIDLPSGATPLDMAYKIHTKVGDSAVGATVNGTLVPLNTVLKTGDVVEIKTSRSSVGPNSDWLDIVITSTAKSHIRKFFQKKQAELDKDENVGKGKDLFKSFYVERDGDIDKMDSLLNTTNVLNNYHCSNLSELYLNIYKKNPTPAQVCDFIGVYKKNKKEISLSKKTAINSNNFPVYIENGEGVKITLGNCCTPIPGDQIVGYITKGMGITVHRKDCPNIKDNKTRLIDVYWRENLGDSLYPVDIQIECNDRPNLATDIINIFTSAKIKVTEFSAKLHQDTATSTIAAQIYVQNVASLLQIFQNIKNINDVYEIKRVIH